MESDSDTSTTTTSSSSSNDSWARRVQDRRRRGLLLLFFILGSLLSVMGIPKPPRRRIWGSEKTGGVFTARVIGDRALCRQMARMSPRAFRRLVERLKRPCGRLPGLRSGRSVFPDEQVLGLLYWLGQRSFTRNSGVRFEHSTRTISKYNKRVLDHICQLAPEYIRLPDPDVGRDSERILESEGGKFREFYGALGAIDGTHIPIFVREADAGPWRDRSGGVSQNCLGVVDFDHRFVYFRAGWEGSAADGQLYDDARANGLDAPPGCFYLGDAGFGIDRLVLPPYRGVRYHLKEWARGRQAPQNAKELFNKRHSSLRNVVERSFGILKKRFPILDTTMMYNVDIQIKIVIASVILHNHIVECEELEDEYAEEWDREDAERMRAAGNEERDEAGHDDLVEEMASKRERIARRMWAAYSRRRR